MPHPHIPPYPAPPESPLICRCASADEARTYLPRSASHAHVAAPAAVVANTLASG